MTPSLALVASEPPPEPKPEAVGQRVKRLQREAKQGAADHCRQLVEAIRAVETLAAEIAAGGDAYPVGAVNEARILAEDCAARAERINIFLNRSK